jgi:hypothetical protein
MRYEFTKKQGFKREKTEAPYFAGGFAGFDRGLGKINVSPLPF